MIAMAQDPALPFDPNHITAAAYPAMSFPLAPVILLAWVVPFLVTIVLAFLSLSPESDVAERHSGRMWVAAGVTGLLLMGPVLVNSLVRPEGTGHDQDVVPNVVGYVLTTKPDAEGEFTDWARQRYGVELTNDQSSALIRKKVYYGGRTDTVSDVVLLDGHEVHGLFDAQGKIRLMGNGVELEEKR